MMTPLWLIYEKNENKNKLHFLRHGQTSSLSQGLTIIHYHGPNNSAIAAKAEPGGELSLQKVLNQEVHFMYFIF